MFVLVVAQNWMRQLREALSLSNAGTTYRELAFNTGIHVFAT